MPTGCSRPTALDHWPRTAEPTSWRPGSPASTSEPATTATRTTWPRYGCARPTWRSRAVTPVRRASCSPRRSTGIAPCRARPARRRPCWVSPRWSGVPTAPTPARRPAARHSPSPNGSGRASWSRVRRTCWPAPTAPRCSPASWSPTSSDPRPARPRSGTAAGRTCSPTTTRSSAGSWPGSVATRSTRPAMASWSGSPARPRPSDAPEPSGTRWRRSTSPSAPACTPVSAITAARS